MLKDKLIAFDLDGTLADKDGGISEFTAKTISSLVSEGYKITLITGRNIISSLEAYNKCNLNLPGVYCNGSLVADIKNDKIIYYHGIPKNDYENILNDSQLMNLVDDILIENNLDNYALNGSHFTGAKHIGINNIDFEPGALLFWVEDIAKQEIIKDYVNKSDTYHYRYWGHLGEFYQLHLDKLFGAKKLVEAMNLTLKDLVFFGDAENDKTLLMEAGLGIALANADNSIKNIANEVTIYPHYEDGACKHLLAMIEKEI